MRVHQDERPGGPAGRGRRGGADAAGDAAGAADTTAALNGTAAHPGPHGGGDSRRAQATAAAGPGDEGRAGEAND